MIGSTNARSSLESSCSDHAEMMIKRGAAHDSTELSGHAMMMSCPPHSYIADSLVNPDMPYPHEIPNIPMQDFDVMVASNTTVDMNGEVNPFGALNMIRNDSRYSSFTPEELNNIKAKLQLKSRCYGYVVTTLHPTNVTPLSLHLHLAGAVR